LLLGALQSPRRHQAGRNRPHLIMESGLPRDP
jgi:hypothetical protein